ncbi:MAG TPA: MAPEG family protein [Stellaceae bacterium]|nr:MAPEG family protein [Stellaceae bacterium]
MKPQAAILREIAIAFAVATSLWLATYFLLPPLAGMEEPLPRLVFALKCGCVAVLFCFVLGIEAIAHERLRSPAIDPLAGYQTRRMTVNLRYLQNTLEQLLVFLPGLFGLAYYCDSGAAMRAVAATTLVWIVGRFAFWIGYHQGPLHRAAGAPSMMLGMAMLLYVGARFGNELAGWSGGVALLVLFFAAEAILFLTTKPMRPLE